MNIFPDMQRLPDEITVTFDKTAVSFPGTEEIRRNDFCLTLRNNTVKLTSVATPVTEIQFRFLCSFPQKTRFCGDAWERGYGDLEFRGFAQERIMPWYFTAVCGEATAMYGVKVRPDAMCSFTVDPMGITLTMVVSCGSDPVFLNGKTVTCAELICTEYHNTPLMEAQHDFALQMAKGLGIFPQAPVYGFNNWYYAYGTSSALEITNNAGQLARLTKGLKNRPFCVIDDCWQAERPTGFIGGSWRRGNRDFPDMKALADEIKALNIRPGIWMRPLQNKDENIPEHCYRYKPDYLLDPTHPDTLQIIREDINTLCKWGYELIKYDYSTNDIFDKWGFEMGKALPDRVHFYDKSLTTAMAIKQLYQTVFDAAQNRALILGCNCIGHLGVGFMQLNRTGDDTSGNEWGRTRKMGVNTLAFRMHQHNAFYFVDADCVGITKNIAWQKNEQWLKALALSGTPLFVSTAPTTLNSEQQTVLAEYLKKASEVQPLSVPVGQLDDTCPVQWLIDGRLTEFGWY